MGTQQSSVTAGARRGPGRPPAHAGESTADLGTRRRILLEARRLYLQRGYADVSVSEIASAVGVTKPTLYYHFRDKEGLYADVLCDLLIEIGGYVRQVARADLPLRQRLHDLALGYLRHADYTMEPMLRDATALLGTERAAQTWETYEREFLRPFDTLMAAGVTNGELRAGLATRTLVRAFFALLDALTPPGGHLAHTDTEHQATAATIVSLFLDGAASERARSVLSS
jgi:AcrR family transcriptional regulator